MKVRILLGNTISATRLADSASDKARNAFMKACKLGPDPTLLSKVSGVPVGLKVCFSHALSRVLTPRFPSQNLGATCYANAFLQACVGTYDASSCSSQTVRVRFGSKTCHSVLAYIAVSWRRRKIPRSRSGSSGLHYTDGFTEIFQESPIFQLQATFAAMQTCKEVAFNPVKLVESLKLRTTEQQDAQECVCVPWTSCRV